jgi:membrane associated rhomboid family serine protease
VDRRDPELRDYLMTIRESVPRGVPLEAVVRSVSAYDLFVFRHGFRPAAPQWADLLTSIFLHGGFMHLFGNMLFLWIYGDNVEHRLGRFRYLLWYLGTGVAATLFYTLFAPGSKLPLVGASGAISGVLGFYFLWFPRNTVRLFVFLFPFFMNTVQVPARIVLGFYLVIDNLLPFVFSAGRSGGGVAHGAHIGGFLAGLAVAWLMNRREVEATPRAYRPAAQPPRLTPTGTLAEAIQRGQFLEAARAYFGVGSEHTHRLLAPSDSLALADWLAQNGQADAALTVYRRHLRDYPGGPGAAEAHLHAGLIQLEVFHQAVPAYQHFLEALEANPSPEVAARARAALQAIAELQKYSLRGSTRPQP